MHQSIAGRRASASGAVETLMKPDEPSSPVHDLEGQRVLFLDYQFRELGGLENYNIETVRAFRRLGADVRVWSCFTSGHQEVRGVPVRGLEPSEPRWMRPYSRWWRLWLALNWALLRDPELSRTMGANGRQMVEREFALAHFDARWRELLRSNYSTS